MSAPLRQLRLLYEIVAALSVIAVSKSIVDAAGRSVMLISVAFLPAGRRFCRNDCRAGESMTKPILALLPGLICGAALWSHQQINLCDLAVIVIPDLS